jgi:ethanolamine ammonia-lyase large subunit
MERQKLIEILRAAGRFMEGDFPSGFDMLDEKMREMAREELSAIRVGMLNNAFLVDDEVSEVLADHLYKKCSDEMSQLTLGSVKKILLGNDGARFAGEYCDGMSSVLISALVKIMTDKELGEISWKIFNPLPGKGEVFIGSQKHLGSRIQPNSAGDKEEEILFFILDALSYGCGDVMIGLNPACDDVETVMRLENFLADIVKRLALPTRWCVLSDIVKLARAKELGAKVDLGFQSLAGTSKALKGMVGLDAKEIRKLAEGFSGLYFEIGLGLEVSNGTHEGVYDMRTLTSRAAGLARYIGQKTGKWMVVNTVTNFIGRGVYGAEEQVFRAALEDIVMLKLHGITGGIDVCAPIDMGIHPKRLRALTEKIVTAVLPPFVMSIPSGFDDLLGYETTSSRAYPALCVQNNRHMTSAMQNRLEELGVTDRGLPKATPGVVVHLYDEYQKAGGDTRPDHQVLAEAKRKISALQAQDFDVGYGCPARFIAPAEMEKRVNGIYENGQKMLYATLDSAVLWDVSPKRFETTTYSLNREDYLAHPKTGENLRQSEEVLMRWRFFGRNPKILLIFSDGLNPNALNENLRAVVPGLRRGLESAGFHVSHTDIVVKNGRMRGGYDVGRILKVPLIIHFFGERPGTGKNMLSVGITYGFDKRGKSRFHRDMDHSCTTMVCGIHKRGKHPDTAIEEIVALVKLMFEKKCSGVELNAR